MASIGEPWDFKSPAGQGALAGIVLACAGKADGLDWVLCQVFDVCVDGVSIATVCAKERMRSMDRRRLCEKLAAGMSVPLNLVYAKDGLELTHESAHETLDKGGRGGFLIGSIALSP